MMNEYTIGGTKKREAGVPDTKQCDDNMTNNPNEQIKYVPRECLWCQHTIQKYVYVVRKVMYSAWLEGKGVVKDKHNRIMKGNRLGIKGVICYDCLKTCSMNDDIVLLDDISTHATKQAGGMTIRALDWHFQRTMMSGSNDKSIWTKSNTRYEGYHDDNKAIFNHKQEVKKRNKDKDEQ